MEPPQERILLLEDTDEFVRWRIPCYCDDQRHDWMFEIEWNKKWNDVLMYIYGNVYAGDYRPHPNIFVDLWRDWTRRVRLALRILFLGEIEYGADLGFKSEQQIRDLALHLMDTAHHVHVSGKKYGEADPDVFEEGDFRGTDGC